MNMKLSGIERNVALLRNQVLQTQALTPKRTSEPPIYISISTKMFTQLYNALLIRCCRNPIINVYSHRRFGHLMRYSFVWPWRSRQLGTAINFVIVFWKRSAYTIPTRGFLISTFITQNVFLRTYLLICNNVILYISFYDSSGRHFSSVHT